MKEASTAAMQLAEGPLRVPARLNPIPSQRITTDTNEFVQRFDGGLVNVVYAWANGATFESLTGVCWIGLITRDPSPPPPPPPPPPMPAIIGSNPAAYGSTVLISLLTGMCDLFEGSIIRAIRRLSELLDELQSAAKAIGNDELYHKIEEGAKLIRRDIVFAASLYIEG